MPDPFFSAPKSRKRKRSVPQERGSSASKKSRPVNGKVVGKGKQRAGAALGQKKKRDEELSDETQDEDDGGGIDEMDLRAPDVNAAAYESGDEDEDETPAEKRLRLAKMYLDGVKQGLGLADGEFDAAEIDRELISSRLKQDVLEHSGKIHLFVADSYDLANPPLLRTRGHHFSATAAVASTDGRWLFTSGKDGSIIKWDLYTGRKSHVFHKIKPAKDKGKGKAVFDVNGHTDEVWTIALSVDGKYLASGGKDRRVGVWDVEKNEWVKGFSGHRDHISALAFRKAPSTASTSTQLYSGSFDRTLKLFDLSSMGYVETLFGHQAPVLSLDALRGETAVSAGGRDKTVRYWKIPEETQLVFRGGGRSRWFDDLEGLEEEDGEEDGAKPRKKRKGEGRSETKFVEGSIECVAMIDESIFVSGGDSGSISLWTTQKKKPVFTQGLAHGIDESQVDTEDVDIVRKPRWVTAIGCLRYSDTFASGSWDGDIRLWKLEFKLKSFSLIGSIAALGVVNSLQFITPPKEFFEHAEWSRPQASTDAAAVNGKKRDASAPVVLVAGVGKEMRFGRWVQKKGDGVINGALLVALHPRTLDGC
ncbi:WD40 repeat-like protein [Laetiporus sulphureus 93-53]|uniref:WD40 repeat-like protein n=1 Tax=Laetiporus sulphureus 93-53 TaxID=1314785 RepID=A0A165BT67_9APHY|nr:WD40 repeat-like protein [Laetiporus sulphureus 93-53]KZT01604.1 WD40 repeat-like protein [Laetiporus sulphureus 93-53]